MSKISKFIKLNKDVLLEYIYDDSNLLSEPYNILINSRNRSQSYISTPSSETNNIQNNSLFRLDIVENKWGRVNTDIYSFLQIRNYSASMPIQHDTIKIHIPINWTFGEYIGFYIRVWGFDTTNQNTFELSNFYFDISDVSQQNLLNFSSPPLLFQEKLWGKNIKLDIPSFNFISGQVDGNRVIQNSLNANLTNNNGLNMTSPIFIDFHFIKKSQTINGIVSYLLDAEITTSIPQTPELERLGLIIRNSPNGDFFEIFGTYNDSISLFKKFIDDSILLGNRYYVQYNITIYEQNIRGKTTTVTLYDNFNEIVEYRPIIKFSTTTAIIDVEMRLIDAVDDSYILRRASYGMLQDEVSKYSLRLMKINIANANKPKIYNIKSSISPDLVGVANSFGIIPINNSPKVPPTPRITEQMIIPQEIVYERVNIPYPVLIDRNNIMAKSENGIINRKTFFGYGRLEIVLYPFDNIIGFVVASGDIDQPNYMDLTGFSDIRFVIKGSNNTVDIPLYTETQENDLSIGIISFKISEAKLNEIRLLFNIGINVFYIVGNNPQSTSVIYTGLYRIYDGIPVDIAITPDQTVIADVPLEPPTIIVTPSIGNQPTPRPINTTTPIVTPPPPLPPPQRPPSDNNRFDIIE
jgi:hypothetical protein